MQRARRVDSLLSTINTILAVTMKEARSMGISGSDFRKKFAEARWLPYKHRSERQKWPWWKRLLHRFQRCPICRSEKARTIEN